MAETLEDHVKMIVRQATRLKDKHTAERAAKVNYAAIFCQTKTEYDFFRYEAEKIGNLLVDGKTGPLYHIKPIETEAGRLKVLKVRAPDRSRPEMGDADFTVRSYPVFKKTISKKPGFRLMKRKGYEMMELTDPAFPVRAYFSNKPIDKELGV